MELFRKGDENMINIVVPLRSLVDILEFINTAA